MPHGARLMVFDDITEVVSGQRIEAWSEVARRLAHEIKNPLTPIQLSAERLQHKLEAKLEGTDQQMLVRSVATIVAQVQAVFAALTYAQAVARLATAQTAYGAINSVQDLIHHPQLRTKAMRVNGQTALIPANPYVTEWDDAEFASTPELLG